MASVCVCASRSGEKKVILWGRKALAYKPMDSLVSVSVGIESHLWKIASDGMRSETKR